jgi:excisionase family DNA binding protein
VSVKVMLGELELPALISIEEACDLLGIKRGIGYRAAATGGLPALRCGHRLLVPTARLIEMLGFPGRCVIPAREVMGGGEHPEDPERQVAGAVPRG